MTRNQKIALGCGGAGCLGLIVLTFSGLLVYSIFLRQPAQANKNHNLNTNRAEITTSDEPSTSGESSNSNERSSSDETPSSMPDDDKHRLFQAASLSGDNELMQRVLKKFGFMQANGSMTKDYQRFAGDHFSWATQNLDFIQSINTPEKARAYVEAHIED